MNKKTSLIVMIVLIIIKMLLINFKIIKYTGIEHGALLGANLILALNVLVSSNKKKTKSSYKNIKFSKR